MPVRELLLADAAATEVFGARLAACCEDRLLVFLHGELGAGKTTLVRGLLRALGHRGAVKSPTYTLVESYRLSALEIHHLDLYRLTDPEELEWLGIRDLLAGEAMCVVEWPERGTGVLPDADLHLTLDYHDAARRLTISAPTSPGRRVLRCLQKTVSPSA